MNEFKKQGLGNNHGQQVEDFDGCPRGAHSGGLARRGSSSSESSVDGQGVRTQGVGKKKKPSLLDRLNPKIDADGDGKKGFMS